LLLLLPPPAAWLMHDEAPEESSSPGGCSSWCCCILADCRASTSCESSVMSTPCKSPCVYTLDGRRARASSCSIDKHACRGPENHVSGTATTHIMISDKLYVLKPAGMVQPCVLPATHRSQNTGVPFRCCGGGSTQANALRRAIGKTRHNQLRIHDFAIARSRYLSRVFVLLLRSISCCTGSYVYTA
jgi:hypothetical protein